MPPLPEGQVVYMPADLRRALAFNRPKPQLSLPT